ncbi:hypothetical protein AVEN_133545-1 [Araneus ventricosus]|uniref:Uncharacterized protein n=1 Tax=Araneus ventricosus TaxID=182803 RepID=A0A4Y2MLL8_ARAVE|nr:hypothetical protein AVEN_133545-1 [Araneus ventricosus]
MLQRLRRLQLINVRNGQDRYAPTTIRQKQKGKRNCETGCFSVYLKCHMQCQFIYEKGKRNFITGVSEELGNWTECLTKQNSKADKSPCVQHLTPG